jgi:hypothetical protein
MSTEVQSMCGIKIHEFKVRPVCLALFKIPESDSLLFNRFWLLVHDVNMI